MTKIKNVMKKIVPTAPDDVMLVLDGSTGQNAFEPDRRNFKKLSKSTEGMENVEIFNCAVWDCDTELMFADKAGRQSAVSSQGSPKEARSVDSVLAGGRADIIKMDVAGGDADERVGGEGHVVLVVGLRAQQGIAGTGFAAE